MFRGLAIVCLGCIPFFAKPAHSGVFRDSDFLEMKSSDTVAKRQDFVPQKSDEGRRARRQERAYRERSSSVLRTKEGGVFDVGKVNDYNYKVLRDDQVVELRNRRSGRLDITIVKASALPEEDLNRYDLEYEVMELDRLAVQVDKHDDVPREVKVDWKGNIRYPLVGDVHVKGKTLQQIEDALVDEFKQFVIAPDVRVQVTQKSPLARILVLGQGFKEFEGHEKVLDVLGADYETTWENVYDRFCVIREKDDGSHLCIVVDMEHMFKKYDFRQNIPLKAGDIILVKKMPGLFGNRFKFWWHQILDWMNEADEALNAVKSIHDWRLD